ncbi:MAG: NFACT family protein, partial [Oscillospiraceae bacterium]|nr:NFACT family protein [Oscillospiraceae bacterium]
MKNELLEKALNSRIDKIHQPSREELVLLIRSKGFNKKVLISIKNPAQRINFTDNSYENPMQPPMFCMLLRKHLGGAKLVDIKQCGFERILTLEFDANNEMGDVVHPKLVVEFIGVQSNIILVDTNRHIIDAVKRSDIESSSRLIQPGAVYEFPLDQNKILLTSCNVEELSAKILSNGGDLTTAIVSIVDGISPLVAREVS